MTENRANCLKVRNHNRLVDTNVESFAVADEKDRSAMPELLYRFIEHYKWEPQHLRGTTKQFQEKIRRQEVPLNFVLNVLLRYSSSETILAILRLFGLADLAVDEQFRLEYPREVDFTQSDVRIESKNARIFIELKVDANIRLEQVRKYLALHALMDSENVEKRPHLFFLTEKTFRETWKPVPEANSADDVQSFLRQMTTDCTVPDLIVRKLRDERAVARYETIKSEVIYGAATWSAMGKCLMNLSSQWRNEGTHDIECRILDDFSQDLVERGFAQSPRNRIKDLCK